MIYIGWVSKRGLGMSGRKTSFTLIELLVVVAIIAVLVAILLPVMQQARAKAKSVVCLHRFHQLAILFSYYQSEFRCGPVGFRGWATWRAGSVDPFPRTADNKYSYFGWYSGERSDAFGNRWYGVGKYVDMENRKDSTGTVQISSQRGNIYCTNYHGNPLPNGDSAGYAVNWDKGLQTVLPHPTQLDRPDNTPMLWCGTFEVNGEPSFDYVCYPTNKMWGWANLCGDEMVSGGYYVHRGSSNFFFFDGHAIAQPALSTPREYLYLFDWGTRYQWH